MPVLHALLDISDLVKLDERQQELLSAAISAEIRDNPEIREILRLRAEKTLQAINSIKSGKK